MIRFSCPIVLARKRTHATQLVNNAGPSTNSSALTDKCWRLPNGNLSLTNAVGGYEMVASKVLQGRVSSLWPTLEPG